MARAIINDVRRLQRSPVRREISSRLKEFRAFKDKGPDEWFSELCFCILTANSKAATAMRIQAELGAKGFLDCGCSQLSKTIRRNRHRFHNNKAKYIVEARRHSCIKETVLGLVRSGGEACARAWLARNVMGLGYKEASHFMRNVGYATLAVIDRHILSLLLEGNYISEKPRSMTPRKYLELEAVFQGLADKLNMSPAELDLYMWFMKTGKVLK